MSDYIVREGRVEDVETLAEFNLRHAAEIEDMQLDRETCRTAAQAVFDDPGKGTYYVATKDDAVVACLLTVPEWSDWRNGTVIWIHSVYVVPEHRRQGIYRKIYDHLKAQVLADDSLKGLRLYVDKTNTGAQATYRAMGMTDDHYAMFEWLK